MTARHSYGSNNITCLELSKTAQTCVSSYHIKYQVCGGAG